MVCVEIVDNEEQKKREKDRYIYIEITKIYVDNWIRDG